MIKVSSPVPYGCGAFIAHKSPESVISSYKVSPYNPYWALVPPAIRCLRTDRWLLFTHRPIAYRSEKIAEMKREVMRDWKDYKMPVYIEPKQNFDIYYDVMYPARNMSFIFNDRRNGKV